MEIDGVISHSLALGKAELNGIEQRLAACMRRIELLIGLRTIHHDDALRENLSPFTNIRQLVASPTHILGFLQTTGEEMLYFQGHHLDTIQLYLDLREHCAGS